ncbi:glutathione peroxidase [Mangrovimonas aestuarii]|uniref:glutathione peroxidase n=1 Tax=Mangrovimonas aestuarii TaxID=3018443 RepID=UPI002378BAF9|nr:glutathione peroxidase [Mangrovimonas aestuarii]
MQLLILSFFNSTNGQNPSQSIYDIKIDGIDGNPIQLSQFKGKKMLIVNVASECGFTPQYEDLEKLYETYKDELVVIGVPCNQFGGQEPGTEQEIQTFCQTKFGVSFIMTEKVDVKGKQQHPLYKWLTNKSLNGVKNSSVKWNFQKYLIDDKGHLIDYYYSLTKPLSNKITKHL